MKLRIPIVLFIFGSLSGVVQLIINNFDVHGPGRAIVTTLFFGFVAGAIYYSERKGFSDKKVNPVVGIILISVGIWIDYTTS